MSLNHVCDTCNKTGAKLRCSSCKRVYYCDKKCQRIDWKSKHKKQCTQKYLQSSIKNHTNNCEIKDTKTTQHSVQNLPSLLFNKNKFIQFCLNTNQNLTSGISSSIYSYLTSYKTTFIINNKQIEMYWTDHFKTLFIYRVNHMDNYQQFKTFLRSKESFKNNQKQAQKRFQLSDWIQLREYGMSILRDSMDDIFGDAIDINMQICPPDGLSMSHCIAQFRAVDIMEHFNGNLYAQLIKCLLDWFNIPYGKFKSIALSHSVTNDNQIRKDLLNTLRTDIKNKIKPTFDYWSGEIGMKYDNVVEYEAVKQAQAAEEDCSVM